MNRYASAGYSAASRRGQELAVYQGRGQLMRAALCVAALAPVAAAWAADPPAAGDVLRQLQAPPVVVPAPDAPALDNTMPRSPVAEPGGARVQVRAIRITGATRFTEEQLLALVQDAAGQSLDLAQLQQLAERISLHYRRHGYTVARAYLPAQQLQDGVLEIGVLEGRLESVAVNNPGLVAPSALPLGGLRPGEVVTDAALERALLLAGDLPGIEARGSLQPGDTVGTTRLAVDLSDQTRAGGSAELDNWGGEMTGRMRAGARLWLNNPLHLGDLASAQLLASEHGLLRYGRLSYQLPVGSHGSKLGLSVSALRYRLGGAFESLQAHGLARVQSAFASHPLLRSRQANLNLQLGVEHKRLHDSADATAIHSAKTLRQGNLGLSGDRRDDVGGGGITVASLLWTQGRLRLDPATAAVDAASARTQENFGTLGLSLLRLQTLGERTQLYTSWQAQWASKNLDGSEKMPLGGARGVRAYAQGEASSDDAQLLTLELRRYIGPDWQLLGFVDAAHGKTNHSALPGGADNSKTLKGAGLGLGWQGRQGHFLRAWAARPIGTTPAGIQRGGRLWVQAGVAF